MRRPSFEISYLNVFAFEYRENHSLVIHQTLRYLYFAESLWPDDRITIINLENYRQTIFQEITPQTAPQNSFEELPIFRGYKLLILSATSKRAISAR